MPTEPSPTPKPTESSTPALPIKKYIMYILVGGLVVSALISIVAVLAGSFGDTAGRALGTTLLIVLHALIGLAFLSVNDDRNISRSLVLNTSFGIVVASMVTSILGTWDILPGAIVGDLYGTFFVVFLAVLVIATLLTAHLEDKVVKPLVTGSIVTTVLAGASLLPWIFKDDYYQLSDFYYRLVAALFILEATMVVLTVIFERLYLIKHPQPALPAANPHAMPLWVKILLFLIIMAFGGWMVLALILDLIFR